MATPSSSDVRSASSTCRSQLFATMHATGAWDRTSWSRTGSFAGVTPARRVDPNATSVAVESCSSAGARAKNSSSFGFAPGQPPSMYVTPRWSSCSATRSLSSTVSDSPSC